MDATTNHAKTVEVPYRWLEAYEAGLAWKLSEIYAPQQEDKLFARYDRAYNIAAGNDVESVSLMVRPGLGGYYR